MKLAEDFDADKVTKLGLKEKSFIRIQNIASILPVEDSILKKKKKRHMFAVSFYKEALNNSNIIAGDSDPKNKPLNWTFAVQQTEEYFKWIKLIPETKNSQSSIQSQNEQSDNNLEGIRKGSDNISSINLEVDIAV